MVDCSLAITDISDVMEERIKKSYGFDPGINKTITKDDKSLSALWKFFEFLSMKDEVVAVETRSSYERQLLK